METLGANDIELEFMRDRSRLPCMITRSRRHDYAAEGDDEQDKQLGSIALSLKLI